MRSLAQSREPCRLDECNHVVKPVLNQFAGMGWEVIDLTDNEPTRPPRIGRASPWP